MKNQPRLIYTKLIKNILSTMESIVLLNVVLDKNQSGKMYFRGSVLIYTDEFALFINLIHILSGRV